ncbi:hypothetical protein T03_11384 [Trichinella britovi]|nr:hypothetical protein T03_11384 [Trichinella britovi]
MEPALDNREVAMRRLRALRQQLNRDPEKDQEYSVTTLTVDRQKKWMEHQVRQKELARVRRFWRMERDILKQLLEPGPRLQPDLVAVLLRFRRSRIAPLRLEDRDVCRLLWQERDCGAPVKVYPITWVGFGFTCSPFMAMQAVIQHAQGCGNIDALTDRVLSDMYVDDLVTSCDGVDENGQAIIVDATQVIRTGEHAEGCRVDAHAFHNQQQLNELKRLVAGHPRPVFEIYDELASNASTSLETAAHFPTWEQARNTMYYSRSKGYPRLPARRQDLRLTAEQTTTKSGAQFLMYHSPTNDILIFANEAGVRLLAQSNCWCGDGTH